MLKLLKKTDFLVGLVLSCVSLWYIKIASGIRFGASHPVDIGPSKMPLIYGTLLLVLSLFLLIKASKEKGQENEAFDLRDAIVPILSIFMTLIYVFILPRVGFVISSVLLLLGLTRVLSNKKQNWWILLLIYVLFVVGISLLFGKWFLVDFPEPLFENWGL